MTDPWCLVLWGGFFPFSFIVLTVMFNSNVLTAYENITQNDTYILKDRLNWSNDNGTI